MAEMASPKLINLILRDCTLTNIMLSGFISVCRMPISFRASKATNSCNDKTRKDVFGILFSICCCVSFKLKTYRTIKKIVINTCSAISQISFRQSTSPFLSPMRSQRFLAGSSHMFKPLKEFLHVSIVWMSDTDEL